MFHGPPSPKFLDPLLVPPHPSSCPLLSLLKLVIKKIAAIRGASCPPPFDNPGSDAVLSQIVLNRWLLNAVAFISRTEVSGSAIASRYLRQ